MGVRGTRSSTNKTTTKQQQKVMPTITSELLVTIRAVRAAAYRLGCNLHTPKAKNQAMILNFISNGALEGVSFTRREVQNHLGFSETHTARLLKTMVSEGKLVAMLRGKKISSMRVGCTGKGTNGKSAYTFAIGEI
jgi:hypothetical protein